MQYNTGEGQVKATVAEAVEAYRDSGLGVPFPLPYGEKKEPPRGVTGKSVTPEASAQKAEEAWKTAPTESNIGLRLAPNILVLDEDAHDDKPGAKTKKALENKLVPLPSTWSCTRHGADAESRHHYFTAPEGLGWKPEAKVEIDGKTFGAIDVRHMRLSYLVVWPSQYDGDTYQWYTPTGELSERPPRVDELAELPPEWVEYLSTGEVSDTNAVAPSECYNFTEAMGWLETSAREYDSEPGAIFQSEFGAGKRDDLIARFDDSAHPTMVERQTWAVKMAVFDGEAGLRSVLSTLEEMFCEAVSRRASHPAAVREWRSALTGAVNLVRGEVEAGRKTWKVKTAGLEALDAVSITGAREVGNAVEEHEKAIRRVVLGASAPVVGVAGLIALLCPELVTVRVRGGDDIVRDDTSRAALTSGVLRRILGETVAPVVQRLVQGLEEDTAEHTIASGTKKEVSRLIGASNLSALIDLVANAVADTGRVLEAEKLDRDPWLIGVGDDVLDLREAMKNPDGALTDWIRPRSYDDAVTRSAPVDVEAGLASLTHRRASSVESHRKTHTETLLEAIFPDAKDRRFAQKALGYSMSGNNKMHKFFVWFGPGGGGKGSLSESVIATLGKEYVSEMTPQSFIKGSGSRPDPDYAMSLGTRLSFVNETDEGQKIDAAAIKRATEVRKGRALYSNAVVESDANTVTVMTNRPFEFKHDTAVERRLAVIPFNASRESIRTAQPPVMENWRDRDEEKVYMLRWLVEGFCLAMNESMETEDYPPNIAEATVRFIEAADPSQAFFRKLERTGDPDDFLATAELAEELRKVTGETNVEATPRSLQMRVGRWFKDQGHENDAAQVDKKRGYRGWRLNEGTVLHLPPIPLPEEIEEAS